MAKEKHNDKKEIQDKKASPKQSKAEKGKESERLFNCNTCDVAFNRSASLKKLVLIVHERKKREDAFILQYL